MARHDANNEELYQQYPGLRPAGPGRPVAGWPAIDGGFSAEEIDRMDARMDVIAERLARESAERRAVWEGEAGL